VRDLERVDLLRGVASDSAAATLRELRLETRLIGVGEDSGLSGAGSKRGVVFFLRRRTGVGDGEGVRTERDSNESDRDETVSVRDDDDDAAGGAW
jgi:hypothetical protein